MHAVQTTHLSNHTNLFVLKKMKDLELNYQILYMISNNNDHEEIAQ
jgi:hypothetical protein